MLPSRPYVGSTVLVVGIPYTTTVVVLFGLCPFRYHRDPSLFLRDPKRSHTFALFVWCDFASSRRRRTRTGERTSLKFGRHTGRWHHVVPMMPAALLLTSLLFLLEHSRSWPIPNQSLTSFGFCFVFGKQVACLRYRNRAEDDCGRSHSGACP